MSEITNTSYATTASHCNHNVYSKGLAPSYVADLFIVTNSQYHLRNSDFVIPRFRTFTYGKHSLTYLGPVMWSKLDKLIRSSESLDIFKKRIKTVNFQNSAG